MKNYTMMYKHISNYIKQINQTVNSFVIPLGLFFGTPPSPPTTSLSPAGWSYRCIYIFPVNCLHLYIHT